MKKLILLFIALVIAVFSVSAADFTFNDVPEDEWYYNDVKNAVETGLINGRSSEEYCPDDNLTYAEAIKLAACMHQLYVEGEVSLKNGEPWYQTYVDYCRNNGIITEQYDFAANTHATREGYMQIFANALPDEALAPVNKVADDSIPDVPSSAEYAPWVYKLYRAGILAGVNEEHCCNPFANIKRSEVAAILSRMMDADKRVEFTLGEFEEDKSPLEIVTQPVNITAKAGATVRFTVDVHGGKAPYTYCWQISDGEEWTTIEEEMGYNGYDARLLSFKSDEADKKEARCIITDADGESVTSDTATATFTEADALRIKTHPEDVVEKKGKSVTLTVEAKGGKAPYTYQWQQKIKDDFVNIQNGAGISGALTSELSVKQSGNSAGEYRCIVTDSNGESVSSNAASVTKK